MLFGFMREMKGLPSLREQREILFAAGAHDFGEDGKVYVVLSEKRKPKKGARDPWQDMLLALRPGDDVMIAAAYVLGGARSNVLKALREIGDRGANVIDAGAGETITYSPEGLAMIAFAERAETQMRSGILKRARLSKLEKGAMGGGPIKLKGKNKEAAAAAWADLSKTAKDVCQEFGVSPSTLYRLFGPKGTPVFGRKK